MIFKFGLHCAAFLLLISQTGCVVPASSQGSQRFPVLDRILVEDRSSGSAEYRIAGEQEWLQIRVTRQGRVLDVAPNMSLETGDSIRIGPSAAVAIRFPNESQLYVRSNSHIRIGSVFAFVGELFVRVKGAFEVDTEFVTAGAEGTEWVMKVSPNGDTRCTVLEGSVRVASKDNQWRPRSITASGQNVTRYSRSAEMMQASPEELFEVRRWIYQIDQLVRHPQPQVIEDSSSSFPFIFHFNSYPRHGREMRGGRPDRNDTERQTYPKPRGELGR